jgi:hypothetical protein
MIVWLVFLCIGILFAVFEALYESDNGDKTHWMSITLSFLLYLIFVLLTDNASYIFLWAAARCFFDLFYNHFKGLPWYYLGSSKITDPILKKFNVYTVLIFRIIGVSIFIYLSI